MKQHKDLMEEVYADDLFNFLGFKHCHLGYWHEDNPSDFVKAQEDTLIELIDPLNINPKDIVLDVGGGAGETAIWMAERYGCQVHTVDIVENMTREANKAIQASSLEDRISAICGDILNLDLGGNCYNHIVSVEAIHHFEDKQPILNRLTRLLKPGGRMAFSVYTYSFQFPVIRNIYLDLTLASRYVDSIEVYEDALKIAKLTNIKTRDVSDRILPKSFQLLFSEPLLGRLRDYHIRKYGRLLTGVLLTTFPKFNACMIENGYLKNTFLYAQHPCMK